MSDFYNKLQKLSKKFCKDIECPYLDEKEMQCEGIEQCDLAEFAQWYYERGWLHNQATVKQKNMEKSMEEIKELCRYKIEERDHRTLTYGDFKEIKDKAEEILKDLKRDDIKDTDYIIAEYEDMLQNGNFEDMDIGVLLKEFIETLRKLKKKHLTS